MKIKLILSSLFALCLLSSCKNDLETIEKITKREKLPDISNTDVVVLYSDSGVVQAKLISPQVDNYYGENSFDEFPKGMHVMFYDDSMRIQTSMTSDYAINNTKEKKFEAKRNVVVINEKGEQLNTEHLIWDSSTEKIFSDGFVKITTADEIIFGDGFESNQNFTKYRIFKIKGTINLKN